MPGLIYYIPGRPAANLADLPAAGLAHAFEDQCSSCELLGNGPDGGRGVLLADLTRVKTITYSPQRQEWLKIPGNPAGAWVGRERDEPVRPDDLVRLSTLAGHWVRLADEQDWLAPIARGLAERDDAPESHYLPRRLTLNAEGQWSTGELLDRYAPLWAIAVSFWDTIMAAGKEPEGAPVSGHESEAPLPPFDFARRATAAATVLAANYRLGAAEISLLGLFSADLAERVLLAAVDWPTLEKWLKKKAPAAAAG